MPLVSFADALYDAGYRTALIGKAHFQTSALGTGAELVWLMSQPMAALAPDLPLADRMA